MLQNKENNDTINTLLTVIYNLIKEFVKTYA